MLLTGGLRLVLRRALRDHAVGIDVETLRRELAFQHDLGFVLERVGDDARIGRFNYAALWVSRANRRVLNLEPVLE